MALPTGEANMGLRSLAYENTVLTYLTRVRCFFEDMPLVSSSSNFRLFAERVPVYASGEN